MILETPALTDHIILHHTPRCWMAEFRGPVARAMAAIAGADIVPTGFNGHVPGTVVCSAIALLNPDAEVSLAEAAAARAPLTLAKPQPQAMAQAQPTASLPTTPASCDRTLRLAAEVIGKYLPGNPGETPKTTKALHPTLKRALKIRRALGLIVACSYLRERGWSFEAAHQAL